MARRLRWSQVAADDLEAVIRHVEQDSLSMASEIASDAMTAARRAARSPEAGSIVPEFNDRTLRELLVKRSFRLMYRIKPREVFVVAFLRHTRDITRLKRTRDVDA
jgi:plasmid stabilization system protein ParE